MSVFQSRLARLFAVACLTAVSAGSFVAAGQAPPPQPVKPPVQSPLTAAPQPGPKSTGAVDRDQLLSDFDTIWRIARDHFYDPTMAGLDWEDVGKRYRAQAALAATGADMQRVINKMLDELHASHTGYYTPDDFEYYMLSAVSKGDLDGFKTDLIGITGRATERGCQITGVLEGGPADSAGLRVGDTIVSCQGRPFRSAGSFKGMAGHEVPLSVVRAGTSRPETVIATPTLQAPLRAFLDATRKSVRVETVDGARIGYIHLWTMAHEAFRELLVRAVLERLRGVDGLVLDVRDGYGGNPNGYGDVFYRPDVVWMQRSQGRRELDRHTAFAGPLVLLINEGTRSAKEAFAFEMRAAHRATLVGTRTAGAFLGASFHALGSRGILELAEMGIRLDGKRLEGVGVAPDVTAPSIGSYTQNDAQLRRAIGVLLGAIHQKRLLPPPSRVTLSR